MKTSWTLPSTEEAKVFFARYAKPVGILRKGSIFGQLISGVTEGVILYGLFYMSFMSILPDYAEDGAIWAALACVIVIEGASRVGLTYSIRAIVRKRWKGKDLMMTLFLIPMTLVFVSTGTLLSIYGADDGIKMVATPPERETTTKVDSVAKVQVAEVQLEWEKEEAQVVAEFTPLIIAAKEKNSSNLKLMDRRTRDLSAKERRENQKYTTKKGEIRTKRQEIETAGITEVAKLKQGQAMEMAALRAKYKPLIDTLRSGQLLAGRDIEARNKEEFKEWKAKIEGYSWFLSVVVMAFMLLMIVSITVDEVHKAGSEMQEQVQPGAFYFEDGICTSLWIAVGGMLGSWLRNLVLFIERSTSETNEPVSPPLIWERKKNEINSQTSEKGSTRKPASKKRYKWEAEDAALYCTPNSEDSKHESTNEKKNESVHEVKPEKQEIAVPKEVYVIREKHRGMEISDLTQRLKDYKKRLGEHKQKAIVQKKGRGEMSQRTANAIENNEKWVGYFENLIEVAKNAPEQRVP